MSNPRKVITLQGANMHDIPSFYDEINRVFMVDEDWLLGQSLDALNDLLYGGFGLIKLDEPVLLVWEHFEESKKALGVDVTRAYYESKLVPGSPFNKKLFTEKLQALLAGEGQTYFDIILEVIGEHPDIELWAK
ncbi:RNAse (barnase) inhibitor barstar [Chitinophaga skermanii]|uniref:RNAse (Barnase) inhibitor barstar n=1 Tax=Chitinophaga skermanii TaxID=331697 RepID=A0A327QU85_9BACT|nr:barstar family protein [Chitinophaga skermanii]RAJ08226.1 RNAse (barnase) inhibitor barstar [Chitinophaga skermanii]